MMEFIMIDHGSFAAAKYCDGAGVDFTDIMYMVVRDDNILSPGPDASCADLTYLAAFDPDIISCLFKSPSCNVFNRQVDKAAIITAIGGYRAIIPAGTKSSRNEWSRCARYGKPP